jgi:hypothetical protein
MTEPDRTTVENALEASYRNITTVTDGLGEAELMLPSRCAGWALGDVLYHQLLDARRALRTFASPSADIPDVDDIGYWRSYSPQSGEHEAGGGGEAAAHARHVRSHNTTCRGRGVTARARVSVISPGAQRF